MNNLFKKIFSLLESMLIRTKKFGAGTIIKPPFKIWGKENLVIGKNVFIAENSFLSIVKEYNGTRYNPQLKIGDNVCIGTNFHISCTGKIIIEGNVLMSDRVYIGDGIHDYLDINKPIKDQPMKHVKPVHIKEGCFIGINSVILPGVTIGKNSVIGASSVVTNNIPDYSVAVGIPAKIVKKYDEKSKKWIKID